MGNHMKMPKDKRDRLWKRMESEIARRAKSKDKCLILKGKWKKFVRKEKGYMIFAVDGTWIRNNLCCYFCHGGHALVHEFIPKNEIWVSTRHNDEGRDSIAKCGCKVRMKNQPVSKAYFDSTVLHEIVENMRMKKGMSYWHAHNIAIDAERIAGLLKDPFSDMPVVKKKKVVKKSANQHINNQIDSFCSLQ